MPSTHFLYLPIVAKASEIPTPFVRNSSGSILGEQSWMLVFLRLLHSPCRHTSFFPILFPSDYNFGVNLLDLFLPPDTRTESDKKPTGQKLHPDIGA